MTNQPNLTQMAADLDAILASAKSANGATTPVSVSAAPKDAVTIDAAVDTEANTGVAEVTQPEDTISGENDPMSDDPAVPVDPAAPQPTTDTQVSQADAKASPLNEADVGTAPDVVGTGGQNSSSGANLASAESTAESVVAATAVGGGKFEHFPAAPRQQGEFQLPLSDLVIGEKSVGGVYDFDSGAGEMLLHAVQTPGNIAPIVVKKTGGVFHVIDGWARVMAYRFQFGNTTNILVRVIEWDGSRNDALYDRFASAFLTLKSRKIDKSILLSQFYIAWRCRSIYSPAGSAGPNAASPVNWRRPKRFRTRPASPNFTSRPATRRSIISTRFSRPAKLLPAKMPHTPSGRPTRAQSRSWKPSSKVCWTARNVTPPRRR